MDFCFDDLDDAGRAEYEAVCNERADRACAADMAEEQAYAAYHGSLQEAHVWAYFWATDEIPF